MSHFLETVSLMTLALGTKGSSPEHPVDGIHLGGFETPGLVRELVQHVGGDGCGVCAEQELLRLVPRERRAIPDRSVPSDLVSLAHTLIVAFFGAERFDRVCPRSAR